MSLYQEIILDHYKNPRNFGRLKKTFKTIFLENPFCGDKINMDIFIAKGKIKKIKFSGHGCVISKACASMLTEYVKNKSTKELQKLDKDFIINMLGVSLSPNRLKCALLPLEALKKLTKSF